MALYRRHIVGFLLLFVVDFLNAQVPGVQTFSINEDGASPKILCLQKQGNGFLLVGTTNGLYRFNGHDFNYFSFEDTVSKKAITAIGEDNNHTVWVGLQNGEIGYVQNKIVRMLKAEEGHPAVAITTIKIDPLQTLYFATAGEGIYYYTNKRFHNINMDDGLSDNYVYDMLLTKAGLIACTDKGLNTINVINGRKNVRSYTSTNGLPDNIVRCLQAKDNQQCWIGMQDKGIGIYSPLYSRFDSSYYLNNWSYGQVNSITSLHNQLWVATESSGIVSLEYAGKNLNELKGIKTINTGFTKASNLINDNEGNTWFTSNNQLVKTTGIQLENIIPLSGQDYNEAHAILSDHTGSIWINTKKGLRKYYANNSSWQSKDYALPLLSEKTDITSLFEDKFGHIWVGTMGKGVIIIDPITGKSRNLNEDNLLVDGSVVSINGKDGQVWISSLGGAVFCELTDANRDINTNYTFNNYNKVSGIGSNYIYSTLVDSKNRVWFATDGKGVTVFEKGRFTNYNQANGIKSLIVYSLCEDLKGNIWFSTLEGGVYKYDGKKFSNISVANGLNDATVTALATDSKGNIIAVSKKGVNIIDTKTNSISYLDVNQGLEELNTDLNCITFKSDKIYFISNKGIIRYIPSYQSILPKIVLNNVQLFLKDIDIYKRQKFDYDENNLSFYFTGISFSHPDKIRYQYKLEGFSNEWITTKDNSINFPKLPAGKYTFRVRVSLNNQFPATSEASFSFTINKPFWQRWWFITAVILLISAAIFFYIKTRERRIKRWDLIEKEKIQSQFETLKSQVNPHFLFNSFNTLISVIEENPSGAIKYTEHLSDLYRKIVTYRDNDTITLKEEIELINDYFFIQKERFGSNLQLLVTLSISDLKNYRIAPLTLQLLCENAVKHNAISSETPLTIEIYKREEHLIVKNNINKKFTAEKGAGMGLQNIQKRYQLLSKKQLSIENTGQDFIVSIPLLLS
jgi:ligand-binding sensor domain-containing protein